MQALLTTMLVFGLAATGLAALVRVLPFWPAAWLRAKPLGCVACMAGHGAWITMLGGWAVGAYAAPPIPTLILVWLGATGVASYLLAQTGLFVQDFAFGPGGEGETALSAPSSPPHGP